MSSPKCKKLQQQFISNSRLSGYENFNEVLSYFDDEIVAISKELNNE